MPRPARPEVLALLADVKENPDDLTPWLVLTDWLEENGDEADRARAEYCRLCFDKLGKKTYASDWEKGERRRELYRIYKDAWLGPLAALGPQIQKGLLRLETAHGFLGLVPQLLEHEEAWAWVTYLAVNIPFADLLRPDVSRLLGHLAVLDLWRSPESAQEIVQLAACPGLARLRVLSLRTNRLNEEAARALARSPYLGRLTRLGIYHQGRSPPQVARKLLRDRFGQILEANW